jgi:GT2 family glycosyltransferase
MLKIVTAGVHGVHVVNAAAWAHASPDPAAFARQAFAIPTSEQRFQERMIRHDGVLIEQLLARRQKELKDLPVELWAFGALPAAPTTSVIVPLYGRWDFVEHQLLEFSRDPEFQSSAELLYVIDDPALLDLKERARQLWKMHGVPFKLLWGHANRGYAGANNLGARHAAGSVLAFLNSDVFPTAPGWVSALTRALRENPGFGALGPRLLFADGGIQHAGMELAWDETLGVWVNKHPLKGLDPRLDTRKGLAEQTAITAACMAVRREDFESVGGFDGGFLFGDFEDSDLCLKLREKGRRIGYLPEVELVHLERQSLRLLGDDAFRFKVVLYNAGRHSRKWAQFFSALKP